MSEATFQMNAAIAMKNICTQHRKRMAVHLPPTKLQRPASSSSEPYDMGVLIDDSCLIGLEFKVLKGGRFSYWSSDQHDAYISLTSNPQLHLPLFYAYNADDSTNFTKLLNCDQFQAILENAKISTPLSLPGQPPEVDNHQSMYEWLLALLEDRNAFEGTDWQPIFIHEPVVLEKILQGFPDVIWLLVTAHQGLRFSWALTGEEMVAHIASLRDEWDVKNIQKLNGDARIAAITDAIRVIDAQLIALQSDQTQQHENADDMDDRPAFRIKP